MLIQGVSLLGAGLILVAFIALQQKAWRIDSRSYLWANLVGSLFLTVVAVWDRRIGFVLSTSDDESFHVAPVEGMASRAVPVVRHWPGAQTVYDARWICETPAEMAAAIAAYSSEDQWREAGELAHAQAAGSFEMNKVFATWYRLLREDLPPAASVERYPALDGPLLGVS